MQGAQVGLIMGSRSDWNVMQGAAEVLEALGIPVDAQVVSAHRTPDRLYDYARSARDRGLKVIIAGAGGAAHLPGMCAAMTPVPVLGVPVSATALNGVDALLSIAQMPKGIPVATFAIGAPGAVNAGLFAAAMLAAHDPDIAERLDAYRQRQTDGVPTTPEAS
ncbi:MAG: 5-(carboxyamino)imidazole ribonucleotide mutase [Halieaceae bacterium]|jgi:5-(carboxyamino)imidazole ribonucleotide mutase|nr:5-(carboxyamino)imidazole ribonucleotide mutase [Halieaceae bacterium]